MFDVASIRRRDFGEQSGLVQPRLFYSRAAHRMLRRRFFFFVIAINGRGRLGLFFALSTVLVFLLLPQDHSISTFIDIALMNSSFGFLSGLATSTLPLEILFAPFSLAEDCAGRRHSHGALKVRAPRRMVEIRLKMFIAEAVVGGDVVGVPLLVIARLALLARLRGEHFDVDDSRRGMSESGKKRKGKKEGEENQFLPRV